MHFILSNIRCFKEEQDVPIKKLTLLVGENSSGKTTLLSALYALLIRRPFHNQYFDFNVSPFAMGGYDNIATINKENNRISKTFNLGQLYKSSDQHEPHSVIFEFCKKNRSVALSKIKFYHNGYEGTIYQYSGRIFFTVKHNGKVYRFELGDKKHRFGLDLLDAAFFISLTQVKSIEEGSESPSALRLLSSRNINKNIIDNIFAMLHPIGEDFRRNQRIFALAPVRSKPLRTYEPFSLTFDPEGGHVPAKYAEFVSSSNRDMKQLVIKKLNEFGKNSGLFDELKILSLGRKSFSPFQVMVSVGGLTINLADVGYGVSQILPIIIESLLSTEASIGLLQQPEVHLHPRAQAALSSFMCSLVEKSNTSFVIETHSDYIIDRIRYEIAQGKIDNNDVQLLFFDKVGPYSKIYPIEIDNNGNIIDPPDTYRRFFLDEEFRVLTRTSPIGNKVI